MSENFKPHLFLKKAHKTQQFNVTPRGGRGKKIPEKDRIEHGNLLLSKLNFLWETYNIQERARIQKGLPTKNGEYVTFKSSENNTLSIKSLDTDGARLSNVKHDPETKQDIATVFIPKDKKGKLISKIEKYLKENHFDKGQDTGKPKNLKLVNQINEVAKSAINDIWTGSIDFLPKENSVWCELWINGGEELFEEVKIELTRVCDFFKIETGNRHISFPERTILTIKVNYKQLIELVKSFGYIAELRKLEELNSFWINENDTIKNNSWIQDSLDKITFNETNNVISILDTGVNNGHKLIAPVLNDNDKLTVNPIWGNNDIAESGFAGHGSSMAGLACYGDLKHVLEQTVNIEVNHKLESIKIIPNKGFNKKESYSNITEQAISIAKISASHYKRIFCLAVTADYQVNFGKPSSWSATIDKIIFGDDESDKKLFVISAGNVRHSDDYSQYPETNRNCIIESPAQAWNALTVGAYTTKTLPNKITLANKNELSPFSRTSSSFEKSWPIKPEVVFEGGNLEKLNNGDIDSHIELNLLTTSYRTLIDHFTTINASSAATALASNFLAKLRNVYSNAWEETLRALIVHSSSWTEEMKNQFRFDGKSSSALDLLRVVGYGVPNIEKAISCKTSYLTFISEEKIQPYKKENKKEPETYQVHYYDFPWPKEVLESMENKEVTLKVTLSYFIEPNPGERGSDNKYSYQSAALKFSLINPGETPANFELRTNKFNKDELAKVLNKEKLDLGTDFNSETGSKRWVLGADNVFKGSVHSNYWVGPAIEIADCNRIAVFPQSSGWWKNLKSKERYNEQLRYSLIVSLETPENSEDIYTEIANIVKVKNLIKV